jgi:hypothetical protein
MQNYVDVLQHVGIGLIASVVRAYLKEENRTWIEFLVSTLVAISAAVLVGHWCTEHGFNTSDASLAVGVTALVSKDLVMVILDIGEGVKRHGKEFLYEFIKNYLNVRKTFKTLDKDIDKESKP